MLLSCMLSFWDHIIVGQALHYLYFAVALRCIQLSSAVPNDCTNITTDLATESPIQIHGILP